MAQLLRTLLAVAESEASDHEGAEIGCTVGDIREMLDELEETIEETNHECATYVNSCADKMDGLELYGLAASALRNVATTIRSGAHVDPIEGEVRRIPNLEMSILIGAVSAVGMTITADPRLDPKGAIESCILRFRQAVDPIVDDDTEASGGLAVNAGSARMVAASMALCTAMSVSSQLDTELPEITKWGFDGLCMVVYNITDAIAEYVMVCGDDNDRSIITSAVAMIGNTRMRSN